MKKKKIVAIFMFLAILLLLVILMILRMMNSNEDKNLNEINIQNSTNINNANDIITNESQNSESIEQNNLENPVINNEENLMEGSENMNNQSEDIKINLIVNNKTFSATLNNNETVKELISMFPMTLHMSDLNANEKYHYLDSSLVTNSSNTRRINAGDIKLYGNNCLVVFYDSFNTSYSYTDLGKVDNVEGFISELGRGNVTMTFELVD